jgi:hypothetical protein
MYRRLTVAIGVTVASLAMPASPTIDEYIAALPPAMSRAASATRALIDRHLDGATSEVLWGHPTWLVAGDPVCYLRATDEALLFGFWNGGSLHDPSGRMRAHGSIMGHAVVAGTADVDEELFVAWLTEARALVRPLPPPAA